MIYQIPLHTTVQIICELESNPENIDFIWKFNNTEIASHLVSVQHTTSTLSYTPRSERDYGILQCTGINYVGYQKHPCNFHITVPGKYQAF